MAKFKRTSLSASGLIREVLLDDPEVGGKVTAIFPIVAVDAELPYIMIRRDHLSVKLQKTRDADDEAAIEILVFAEDYDESVDLAEAVRASLDNAQFANEELSARSCYLADSDEGWDADAFWQSLVFNVKIQ